MRTLIKRDPRFYLSLWLMVSLLVACQVQPIQIPEPETTDDGTDGVAIATPAVAILVVDFFGAQAEESEESQEIEEHNCLAGPNGATYLVEGTGGSSGSTGVADNVVITDVPHGELVYTHLKQQFGASAVFTDVTLSEEISGLELVQSTTITQGTVYLAKLDIGGNFNDQVYAQITQVHDQLKEDKEVSHFVVNMSVVVKPCDKLLESDAAYLQFVQCVPTLAALRERLYPEEGQISPNEIYPAVDTILRPHAEVTAAYYDVGPILNEPPLDCELTEELRPVRERSRRFISQLQGDPFNVIISKTVGITDTFYVAASGNDGRPFPYAPAIFSYIVSTGAITMTETTLGYDPNSAEWSLNDHFNWTVPSPITGTVQVAGTEAETGTKAWVTLAEGEPVVLGGTSFATPKLSYLTTLALLNSKMPDCYPHMIYGGGIPPSGPYDYFWENRPSAELNTTYCAGFPHPNQTTPPSP
jgi:hypothetical protein